MKSFQVLKKLWVIRCNEKTHCVRLFARKVRCSTINDVFYAFLDCRFVHFESIRYEHMEITYKHVVRFRTSCLLFLSLSMQVKMTCDEVSKDELITSAIDEARSNASGLKKLRSLALEDGGLLKGNCPIMIKLFVLRFSNSRSSNPLLEKNLLETLSNKLLRYKVRCFDGTAFRTLVALIEIIVPVFRDEITFLNCQRNHQVKSGLN